jgi:hypothetical protein
LSYNASVVNTAQPIAWRVFRIENFFSNIKRSNLLWRWRCSCKFKSKS